MGFLLRRTKGREGEQRPGWFAAAVGEERELEALVEFLGQDRWEDGDQRMLGTLLLFVEGDRLKACLSDRAQDLVGFVTLPSLGSSISEVSGAIVKGSVDWRASRRDRARSR